ncbi:MAG: homospermidine synthase [Alphaproteobacteria bacterium]
MTDFKKYTNFSGRIIMIGFGSIGQGVLPLIFRHIGMKPEQVRVITADEAGRAEAENFGVDFVVQPLTRDNYRSILTPLLQKGDFVVNLSVEVSSLALVELCAEIGALYIDTCIEPWPGGYTDPNISVSARSNYGLREQALALQATLGNKSPTALLTHGANPGLVSHLVKQALLDIAQKLGEKITVPQSREEWANLAANLGVKVIHIAERDTQTSNIPKEPGEFVNTWSIDGFVSEGSQPAELGWGSHEKHFPQDGMRHDYGKGSAIYLQRPGASTRVRSWTPLEGSFHGFLITHGESISISDYLTKRQNDSVIYRPTVHYAYHPCDGAVLSIHELAGKNWHMQEKKRLVVDEITHGMDELGVLLMGDRHGSYWYGSRLTIEDARALVPYNNATSLQVTVAVLAGIIWAIENPTQGLVEPEQMDFARAMEIMLPYLGEMAGVFSDWTPLQERGRLFAEDVDNSCPWQFKNFRVV